MCTREVACDVLLTMPIPSCLFCTVAHLAGGGFHDVEHLFTLALHNSLIAGRLLLPHVERFVWAQSFADWPTTRCPFA